MISFGVVMKVVLIHGKNADPLAKKWYVWIADQVRNKGLEFVAPNLPNSNDPEINAWIKEVGKTDPDEQTIMIGHSRGGVAILRWMEKLPAEKKIRKVILVAANSGNSEKRNKTENNKGFFTEEGYDFEKIKTHCEKFVVFHSKDDRWVSFDNGEENAKGLGAKFHVFKDRKHFGKDMKEFPELLEEVLR
jgi:uncharacterized protein